MRGLAMIGAAALVAGCVAGCTSASGLAGGWRAPPFADLQQMCGAQQHDYGADTPAVYAAVYDAYVANRHGKLAQAQFCGFQAGLAQHYAASGAGAAARNAWIDYLNAQRAQAVTWRASADPTLRGG
ncbi:hypothetical protein G3N59_14615 [Paraburkholderia sp. Ac-20340]|uniref:hypothetical protein n=1 Tax=Paraburkholderia sp. Ac-20340 TaxID=2703888 RepID=UPI00197D9A79|nr:hypothetical protein [Paraburkholderia sp. Ac-20340]MBN3854616.1 hypothetical protein [Paraburkholderia sp. Ac-20340]